MNRFKRFICLLLVPVFLILCACGAEDSGEAGTSTPQTVRYKTPAGLVKKTETVYVNLKNSGEPKQVIVSDWLHTDSAHVYVDDVTNLVGDIRNIKDDSKPDINGNNLRWYMNSTDLYYQGESNGKLPVRFEISYALNGKKISSRSELIGKSGKVKITIKMHNVDSYKVNVNGRSVTMYNPLIVIGGVAMSESKFQNISVKNGRVTANGNTQVAVLVGFPGINDSLGLTDISSQDPESNYTFDDTFVITADVEDFELGNFMFAAIPIASLDIGLNGITNSMDSVRDTLKKLQSIQRTLQTMNADKLIGTLTSNPNKMKELSSTINQAAYLYDNNKALINVINKYTTPQNMETLSYLTKYIAEGDFDGLENAFIVLNSFFGDDKNADTIQKGINLLREMSNDLKNPEVQAAIDNLPQTVSTLNSLQNALEENKDVLNSLKVLSESNALASLESSLSSLEGTVAAGGISQVANITGNADEITAKMTKWIELGKKYTIFTKKRDNMDSSVMFVFKVDGLKKVSAAEQNKNNNVEEAGGLSSFFNKIFGK